MGIRWQQQVNRCSVDPWGIASILFHLTFLTLCAFVMLNLVIAVILENFQKSTDGEEAIVSRDHFRRYQEVSFVVFFELAKSSEFCCGFCELCSKL
jgi:hypothetical protein